MPMILRRIIIAATGLLFMIAGAKAADVFPSTKDTPAHILPSTMIAQPTSWTGIWAAALVGYNMSNTELSLDKDRDHTAGRNWQQVGQVNGFGGEGFDATVQIGGDYQIGRIVVGGWGEYAFGGVSSEIAETGAGKLSVEQKDSYALFGRVGVASGDNLFYGAGGYVWTEADVSLTGVKTKTFDFSGPAAEIGIERMFSPGIRGKLSARYTWLDEETVAEDRCDRLRAEPGMFSVKAGVVISTSGGLGIFSTN